MKEPKIAQKGPYKVKLEEGRTYAWCRCGLSDEQPYCSGKHKGTGFTPVMFSATETKEVYLCGCKRTGNQPYCDGTHNTL